VKPWRQSETVVIGRPRLGACAGRGDHAQTYK
jgi:hypothetical protein